MTILIICCFALTLGVCLPGYIRDKQGHRALLLKWLGTFSAAVMGIVGAARFGGAGWLCAAGLFVCAIADVVLEKQFYAGMACFAAGHICYVAWFLTRAPLGVTHLLAFLVLMAVSLVTIHCWTGIRNRQALPLMGYALFLSLMGACGVGCAPLGLSGLTTAVGAVLFVASDMMVYRGLLKPWGRKADTFAMGIYYGAQLLFGLSCLLGG